MNQPNEQNATRRAVSGQHQETEPVLDIGVSALPKSEVTKASGRYTLHVRSHGVVKEPSPADAPASDSVAIDAPTQVRYKKRVTPSGFSLPGNTFDMAGQLG